jgi:hypothetical protein
MKKVASLLSLWLRYSPLALSICLLAVWIGTLFCIFGNVRIIGSRSYSAVGVDASVRLVSYEPYDDYPLHRGFFAERYESEPIAHFGEFQFHINGWPRPAPKFDVIMIPIPFLLILLLPGAIGPFCRYRFPLWTWFVWVALIAAATAFYGRQ